ncbi:putative hemolysin [Pasteurella testudinis]|uniref:putative hemolysin n=1 Tax=Pasteurella testudinis TaxID=761 RepID=UPI0040588DE7
MKKPILTLTASALLAACASEPNAPIIGAANPASEYCIQQGGKLEMRQDQNGNQYALCHLPDGRVIEEWAFFRSQK